MKTWKVHRMDAVVLPTFCNKSYRTEITYENKMYALWQEI